MGKYEPLTRYLESLPTDNWDAGFEQIEHVLGFALPASAVKWNAWWANENNGTHSHARGWQDAGWATRDVDLVRKRVRFERAPSGKAKPAPAPRRGDPIDTLFARARALTGIADRDTLMQTALETLIEQVARRELAGLGGAMPDLTVPPRERPHA